VLYRPGDQVIYILANNGGNFTQVFASHAGIGGYDLLNPKDRVFALDYKSSGKLDHLVLYRPGDQVIYILANNGGNFTQVFASHAGIGGYDLLNPKDRVFAFDYKSSGKLDHLVLYRPSDQVIYILANNGGNFTPVFKSHAGIGGYDLADPADKVFAFDYNSSGKLNHLVLYRPGTGTIWIL